MDTRTQEVHVPSEHVAVVAMFSDRETAETAIDAELSQLAQQGPTQTEVDRARNGIERRMFEGLEKVGGNGGRANRLNYYNQYTGDPGYLPKDVERYRRVTPDDVRRVVAKWLPKNARVVAYAERGDKKLAPDLPAQPVQVAGRETESINGDETWRKHPPKPAGVIVPRLPVPVVFKLKAPEVFPSASAMTQYRVPATRSGCRTEVPVMRMLPVLW